MDTQAVVGFPAYPTCHPATAAWDYAQLQRLGASDEVAWQLGMFRIMMALQSVKRE